jgi:ubiquinone/menaquinone biosynthesis C-methylase UbiE
MQLPGRYGVNAAWYDLVALERPIYRGPRLAGIAELRLRPGDRVLDLGCGTGYNLPLLLEAVGPTGTVVGIDASATMLARASRRADHRVRLVHGDAGEVGVLLRGQLFDALLCTYALSVMAPWQTAWEQAFSLLRPGGRAAVVDLTLPRSRWLRPLARLACLAGGADPKRAPWQLLERDGGSITRQRRVAGHVRIVGGTKTLT